MTRLLPGLLVALATTVATDAHSEQRAQERWDPTLLQQWVTALEQHTPGDLDSTLVGAAAWTGDDLRRIWIDAQILLEIVKEPSRTRFAVPPFPDELRAPDPRWRVRNTRAITFKPDERKDLDALAARVQVRGLNAVLRRAAVLHTDVVTLGASIAAQAGANMTGGPLRWSIGDGTGLGAEGMSLHWEMARMVMGRVIPDPRQDAFVRDWYRATVAHGQATEYFDKPHLTSGLRLFPDDPELLLLAGAEREALASPLFQAFARSIVSRVNVTGIGSPGSELGAAADYYRRALESNPGLVEARVRLGRVLGLQRRHADAMRELRAALDADLDDAYRYFALLFLGAALEGAGDLDGAAEAFTSAAATDGARAPHLALARIARERGDRALVAASLERALTPLDQDSEVDPWWLYHAAQGRRRAASLDDVRRRAKDGAP